MIFMFLDSSSLDSSTKSTALNSDFKSHAALHMNWVNTQNIKLKLIGKLMDVFSQSIRRTDVVYGVCPHGYSDRYFDIEDRIGKSQ